VAAGRLGLTAAATDRTCRKAGDVMIRLLLSLLIMILANAAGLAIAVALLPDFRIGATGFISAVALFSIVEVLANPLFAQISLKYVPAMRGSFALVTTFVGIGVIDYVLESVDVGNLRTWLLATLLVWLGALIATLLLPLIFVKKAVSGRMAS
jgi:hypothetical protein